MLKELKEGVKHAESVLAVSLPLPPIPLEVDRQPPIRVQGGLATYRGAFKLKGSLSNHNDTTSSASLFEWVLIPEKMVQ